MTRYTHPDAHPDEPHYIGRSGWLRAAVLGANDGLVSVSSIIVGVAAATPDHGSVLLSGVAGLTAGAMSMAAGEYVSVSSQSDIERADILREAAALKTNPHVELTELAAIYEERGLLPETARQVAHELHEHDALSAHVRDELGLSDIHSAVPLQAALASAGTFSAAAAVPVVAAALSPQGTIIATVLVVTLVALGGLGAIGAKMGGAPIGRAMLRVMLWGSAAMAVTAAIGRIFGVTVG